MGVRTDDIAQARQDLIRQSVFFALFWFAIFMLPFFLQIRRMVRPLANLSKAAQHFANGNLDYPAPKVVQGNDELSQLTTSFQGMAQALLHNRDTQASNMATLNEEKSTLATLLATLPIGVFFADRTHIRYHNDAFRRICLLGKNVDLVGMKNDAMLLHLGQMVANADDLLKAVAKILEVRTLSEPKYIELKDGRILRMISNAVVAPDHRGYLGRFWLFEDMTRDNKMLHTAEIPAEHDS